MTSPLILLVGHCRPDNAMLRSAITGAFAGASIKAVNDIDELNNQLAGSDLLLINRVLDGEFDDLGGVDSGGLELISRLAARDDHHARLMLISNYEDAQRDAVARGALHGFGKKDAYSPVMEGSITSALAAARS